MTAKEHYSSPQKTVGLFLILTLVLSSLSYLPMLRASSTTAQGGLFVITLMWSPGLAALLTHLIGTRSLRGLGWRPGAARWLALAFLLPVGYALPVYGLAWLTGLGELRNPYLFSRLTQQYGSPELVTALAVFVGMNVIRNLPMHLIAAAGEELGWRGLLVPELAKVTSFTRTALISGLIWAAWHMPGVFLLGYNSGGTPTLYAAAWFSVMIVASSFVYAWLRLKSGSVWPAVLLHAGHNLLIQVILDRLTGDTGVTPYLTGEFGLGLALSVLATATVFWRRRPDLTAPTQVARRQAVVLQG